jgi:hypothetical protein
MVKNVVAVALAAGGLLVTTACASASTSINAAPSSSPGTSPTVSGSAPESPTATASAPAASACGGAIRVTGNVVNVTGSDNGKDLCVSLGTTLVVRLQGTPADKWNSVHSSSELILAPKPDPGLTLAIGWTGASFEAIRPGTAYLSASRYPCGTTSPGRHSMQCGVIIGYRVDITVTS